MEKSEIQALATAAKVVSKENLYAPEYKDFNPFFIGKGIDNVTAKEGALKFKEITYKFADAYGAGELKHGSIALIDEKSVAYVVSTNERDEERVRATVRELQSRGAYVFAVTTSNRLGANKTLTLPKT